MPENRRVAPAKAPPASAPEHGGAREGRGTAFSATPSSRVSPSADRIEGCVVYEELKRRIVASKFIDVLRQEMRFDEDEYARLVVHLEGLAQVMKTRGSLDKELALHLYLIPQMTRNAFLSYTDRTRDSAIASQLEDAWVDLDALVIECLT
ncbi:MAG TPA: hypothetical protein PLZ93_16960 [Nocardioides sp.]|uniref:hypothetical protein n=1 Tax=uncultured Nocardioides sp. TaxID=198441 RepID=UPI002612201C|nr:hypothetical protein [uncultured Nocardioides sp.]HRD63351.1 hypothetical protein [Nocardioides sp.]HRI97310.1 hypothetical protein [Nocardioides sp.]HRK46948.1 hypothetical protein [Nocardioides sp.]